MAIQKFSISRDPVLYEAWPDVALTPGGKMIAVFNECTHHLDRSYTRIMLTESMDRGRSWSPKRPLTPEARKPERFYNCPRITQLRDGRLVIIFDRLEWSSGGEETRTAENYLCFSDDEGVTWSEPVKTPLLGWRSSSAGRMIGERAGATRSSLRRIPRFSSVKSPCCRWATA